jgi:hypothetical protein
VFSSVALLLFAFARVASALLAGNDKLAAIVAIDNPRKSDFDLMILLLCGISADALHPPATSTY